MCPDYDKPEDMYVNSNQASPPYRKLDIAIYPCMIPDNSLCLDPQNVKWKLALVHKNYSPDDKFDPVKSSVQFEDISVNPYQGIFSKISLMGVEIYDQDSDFFEDKKVGEYLTETQKLINYGYRSNPTKIYCTMLEV
jgi:hypothetical protein